MKRKKTLKNPKELVRILNTLKPMAARLLLHFILTEKPKIPFKRTLYQMEHDGQIKNAQRAIAEILEAEYITRKELAFNSFLYTLHLDLIE